jgi:multiple sugar transport system permease protein
MNTFPGGAELSVVQKMRRRAQTAFPQDTEWRSALGFLLPLLAFVAILVLLPVLGTFWDSLYRDVPFLPRRFIGGENYQVLWRDATFWRSVRFTVLFVLVSVPLETLLGLGIALLLHEHFALRGLLRACVLIPWAIPAAVSGRVFQLIYNSSYGAANFVLRLSGITDAPVNWLGSEVGAFAAVVLADTWKTTPFAALLLLAGLSAIPEDLYRQAMVDRATLLQRFWRITLPLLRPVLVVTILFRSVEALRIFDILFALTGGGPGGATLSLSLLGYGYFSSGDFGYGAAISVVLFLLALGFSLAYVRLGEFGKELR